MKMKEYPCSKCYIDNEAYLYTHSFPELIGDGSTFNSLYRGTAEYWKESDPSAKGMVFYEVYENSIGKTQKIIEERIKEDLKDQGILK